MSALTPVKHHRHPGLLQTSQQFGDLPSGFGRFQRDRVESDQQWRLPEADCVFFLQPGPIHEIQFFQVVQGGRAGDGNTPGLLAQLGDPGRILPGGYEMNMCELGNRMANRIVDRTFGQFTAMYMGHGKIKWQRRQGRRNHLKAVTQQHQQIRPAAPERLTERGYPDAHRLGHALWCVRGQQHLNAFIDPAPVCRNHVHGMAEPGG